MDGLKRVVETTRSDFFLLLPMLLCIRAFNLDTENTIARGMDSSVTGGRDFAFGVSVTIHQTESGFSMLVGAPKSESRNHADSSRRGAVYSCSIMKNEPCEYKELEEQLNVGVLLAAQFDRGDELFGQTLMSSNGNLVVCAPRFKLNSSLDVDGLLIPSFYPVGRCMLFNQNLQLESVFSPTTTLAGSDLPGQAYIQGQFGFSLSIEGGNDMIVGCPRCWNERGKY
ncbi:integrin alpha-8-like [Corticium candelabrum]|uniref:integrin alpha-8-like n=1 Tax=Corticium candelabrum TaxID=121492 RepID=UPI002E2567DE|nr:integrin alpha-8-like [Corticium candelabrum]